MSQVSSSQAHRAIRLALPKGRMHEGVFALLADAGIRLRAGSRGYRPSINLENFEVKILKPQSIVEMLHLGSRDIGFAGADWCAELGADLVELLDTGMDPVQVVMAAPPALLERGELPKRPLVVASEYMRLTQRWMDTHHIKGALVRSYGATEVFPPEDADVIVDNTATGSTLAANGLQIIHTLMTSSTRLYAHPRVLDDAPRRQSVERFVLLVRSVLEARSRVMLEVNVTPEVLEAVVAILPSMREATVSPLHMARGFAVKAAIRRDELHRVIPEIKARGGTDIVVTALAQIVP
jgi:ATP phosphoribosyltransferase